MGLAAYLFGRYIYLTKKKKKPPSGMIMISLSLVVLSLADAGAFSRLEVNSNAEITEAEYKSIYRLIENSSELQKKDLVGLLELYMEDGYISDEERNEFLALYSTGDRPNSYKSKVLDLIYGKK